MKALMFILGLVIGVMATASVVTRVPDGPTYRAAFADADADQFIADVHTVAVQWGELNETQRAMQLALIFDAARVLNERNKVKSTEPDPTP